MGERVRVRVRGGKIETGRAPTPAFFTVAALAGALGLSMDAMASACAHAEAEAPAVA
ncbi:hypothetical protein [Streptomyces antibioticus]|uniref:hypothetical protein n=1 Tax=Streptomyces antibioticus TaxID=1890 RepID=UPI003D757AD2